MKRLPNKLGFDKGFGHENIKEEDPNIDLKDRPWFPPEFPSVPTAYHAKSMNRYAKVLLERQTKAL